VSDRRAVGYLSLPTATSSHEQTVHEVGCVLAAFATSQGYVLSGVFSDIRGETETGLYAMLAAIRSGAALAVLVIDIEHLRHVGCLTGADVRTASRYLRARVLSIR
jgi:hypothetical protein